MKEYATFLSKRILKRKGNIGLMIAAILLISVILVMNMRNQNELRDSFVDQIETSQASIDKYSKEMEEETKEGDRNEYLLSNVALAKSMKQTYEGILQAYDEEDWMTFYERYTTSIKQELQIMEDTNQANNQEDTKGMIASVQGQYAYINFLKEHHLTYENQFFPVYGLSFTTSIAQGILPVIVLVCMVYVLAQLFTIEFQKEIDISYLLPMGKKKVILVKLAVGMGISMLMFLFLILVSFLLATFVSGNAGLSYPIMVQDMMGTWKSLRLIEILKYWVLLGILFYLCVCLFTYLLSRWIKEEGALFLVVLCLVLGIAYLPSLMGYLKTMAHYLPTTYLNFVHVASGQFAKDYHNEAITLSMGLVVLTSWIGIQLLMCFVSRKRTLR